MTHDISIKIEFCKMKDQEEQQFLQELEAKFRENIQLFMNGLKLGNGKIYDFLVTKI